MDYHNFEELKDSPKEHGKLINITELWLYHAIPTYEHLKITSELTHGFKMDLNGYTTKNQIYYKWT